METKRTKEEMEQFKTQLRWCYLTSSEVEKYLNQYSEIHDDKKAKDFLERLFLKINMRGVYD